MTTQHDERAELIAYYSEQYRKFGNIQDKQAAALLASDAHGWKDVDTAKLVNDLRDVAVQFQAAEQLRERIAHVIRPLTSRLSASPAAPVAAQVAFPEALRIALEDLDSTELIGPTTEAVIDAAQRWYLAAPKAAQVAQPLTEEQIAAAMTGQKETGVAFKHVIQIARAIEAAHGIGNDQG